ncbi:MAG: O-antigen ligase family protein [Ignavibacteriaceae bacterium]|nr:O-antigen ligase family protein [Ignavibacteriaceae bacterium]
MSLLFIMFLKKFGLEFVKYRRLPKALINFLFLYFSAMVISSAMSNYPFAGSSIILKQLLFFIIVYVFYSLIDDFSDIKNYISSIIVVSFIFSTISLIYFFIEGYSLLNIVTSGRIRISILITNPEALTNFYVISFPFLITYIILQKHKFSKWIASFLLFYIVLGLILTMSRSAVIGILLSTSIILYILRKNTFYQLILSLIFIIICFIVIEPLNEIVYLLFRFEEGVSVRDYLWLMAINIIKDYPVFGLGPGAYPYEVFNYFPFMLDEFFGKVFIYYTDVTEGGNLAHNIFLVFFSEMGILGLITIITLPVVYIRIGIKTIKKYKDQSPEIYYLIVALFATGTSVIVRNIFNSIGLLYVGGLVTDLPFWLIFSGLIYFYQTPLSKNLLEVNNKTGSK